MKMLEALKTVLCDSQKGVDWNALIKGKDYILSFTEKEIYSASDCCTHWKVEIQSEFANYSYELGLLELCDSYHKKDCVDESEIDKFLKKQYLFKDDEVVMISERADKFLKEVKE